MNELSTAKSEDRQDENQSLALAQATAAEIQAAITVAIRYPRNENQALAAISLSANRPTFRERAIYRFPRSGKEIKGPSVYLAREFARLWRNIRHGFDVVGDDGEFVSIVGYAYDLETNTKVTQAARIRSLIFRKGKGWIQPDERDKREMVNKAGAICQRNALLQIIPRDMVEDVVELIETNDRKEVSNEVGDSRRKIVTAFGAIGVDGAQLEAFVGYPLAELKTDDIVRLRQIYASIRDGNSTWSEHYEPPRPESSPTGTATGSLRRGKLKRGDEAKPADDPPKVTTSEELANEYARRFKSGDEDPDILRKAIVEDDRLDSEHRDDLLVLIDGSR